MQSLWRRSHILQRDPLLRSWCYFQAHRWPEEIRAPVSRPGTSLRELLAQLLTGSLYS